MNQEEFDRQISNIKENSLTDVQNFLTKTEKTLSQDPEYYVILLNYALAKDNARLITDSISKTQNALKHFSSRLDIRFGVAIAAEKVSRWDIFGNQLIDILKTSKEIDNKWTWGSINSITGEPEKFMLENVQAKVQKLLYVDTASSDSALLQASEALIKYYPKSIYGYANLGGLYLAKNDYKQAEKYLKKALKIDPDDQIVKTNLQTLEERSKR